MMPGTRATTVLNSALLNELRKSDRRMPHTSRTRRQRAAPIEDKRNDLNPAVGPTVPLRRTPVVDASAIRRRSLEAKIRTLRAARTLSEGHAE